MKQRTTGRRGGSPEDWPGRTSELSYHGPEVEMKILKQVLGPGETRRNMNEGACHFA